MKLPAKCFEELKVDKFTYKTFKKKEVNLKCF